MNNLPICIIPMSKQEMILQEIINKDNNQLVFSIDERSKIEEMIKDNVGADCWALQTISINGRTEMIFNSYEEEKKSLREIILDDVVRDAVMTSPHRHLLVKLYRYNIDTSINIYMFGQYPYRIQIDYNTNKRNFTVSSFVSDEYAKKFC